ncbi:MAG: DUF2726 domain-containing protein [Burkholderiales bacterium]|jgi:hypothetical protein|nr:MAG: DUF2726 domain-containing protein [Burkholderiales bacterium]
MMMDVVATWPVLVAGIVGSAGVLGAWWYSRHHQMAPERGGRGDSPRSKSRQEGKAGLGRGLGRSLGKKSNSQQDNLDTLVDWEPVATRVLTSGERDAYHVLRKALPDHMILAQVPVARFIKVPTKNSYSEWLRRVGSLCADLVVCDMASQVVAVVEVRQPISREKERSQRRHARMDRVLAAARIPVHVWLEGALPGPAVAREAILGAAITTSGRAGYQDLSVARRDAEAAAVVASMQSPTGAMNGMSVNETVDVSLDDWSYVDDTPEGERKEPPPSTWFDDLDSNAMPLDPEPVVPKGMGSKRH